MGVAKTNNLIFLGKKKTTTHTTKCSLLCDLSVLFIPLAEAVLHLEEEKVTFFYAIYYFIIYLFLYIEMSSAYCTVKFHTACDHRCYMEGFCWIFVPMN